MARDFYRHGQAVQSRLPIVGKVRLGYRDEAKRGAPVATPYFVLKDAPQLVPAFGEQPTEIGPVFIPLEDETAVASRMLRYYTETYGLTCWGNGREATRKVDKAALETTGELKPASKETRAAVLKTLKCPCQLLDSGDCKESMYFRFAIPHVEGIGVFQLATRSRNSIDNIFSCLDMIRAASVSDQYPRGRISGIPLKLSLRRAEVYTVGDGMVRGGKKWVYLVFLEPYEQTSLREFFRRLADRPPMMALPDPDADGAEEEEVQEADFLEIPPVQEEGEIPAEGPAGGAPPAPTEGITRPLDHNDVYNLAKELGYHVRRVPAILGSRQDPVSLPEWINQGGTYEGAMGKLRQYHQMDKGGRRS
jgi:hypothetical protein